MRLGVDFDNTIVCYDELFHRVAREDGTIPADLPINKSEVRNYLRATGREDVWTEMQGRVYGSRMSEAVPFPGVFDFFSACREAGVPVFIISHKSRYPFAGERHDLHAAALKWLREQGFLDPARLNLPRDAVFLEPTKAAKLERIAACACTHFIDDLPEFLDEPAFPPSVQRLLFDPNRLYPADYALPSFSSWTELTRSLGLSASPPTSTASTTSTTSSTGPDAEFESQVAAFLHRHNRHMDTPLQPLPGGANNRVYRVQANGRPLVLKRYFHSAEDSRDRFGAERAFYEWAWNHGARRTPQPLAWDAKLRLGLFEYVEGRKLVAGEASAAHIRQATEFIAELNRPRELPEARAIPFASEASFCIAEHVEGIEGRVRRLQTIAGHAELDLAAAAFVRDELSPKWQVLRSRILSLAGGTEDPVLSAGRRCLSPSDFGFHNALLPAGGELRFLDFEYAGWDDPAKLVCDFFCQPQVQVDPEQHWSTVVEAVDSALGWTGALRTRAELLLPAYRLKWCCIFLNEFLRGDRARREFARGDGTVAEYRAGQLTKARAALAQLE